MDLSDFAKRWLRASAIKGTRQLLITADLIEGENSFGKKGFELSVKDSDNGDYTLFLSVPHIQQLIKIFGSTDSKMWVGKLVNVTTSVRTVEGKEQKTFEFLGITEKVGG